MITLIEQLLKNGMDVRFTRNVNHRAICEIRHWNGTLLASATGDQPYAALRAAIEGIEFMQDDPQPVKPARRLHDELRKRGIMI